MSVHYGDAATGLVPYGYPAFAQSLIRKRFTIDVDALVADDLLIVGVLPLGCSPSYMVLDSDALDVDAEPTAAVKVGLINDAIDDVSEGSKVEELFTATEAVRAGGVEVGETAAVVRVTPVNYDRAIALEVTAGAATAKAGQIGLTVFYTTE
ncbi:hypothetical protein C8N35_11633 [Breoghania corrubedonensis]|uniref:Uncharacterized protein n=1 Tax=Breoghania corrubedonensis TaxID=665038 RepID=A0A2T5UPY0_9HYPH|nr:hypothetical protein [Breoghania corrubedonensis]PTW53578.1 hypothetical protein C8N35_11633 [Breoghania corrubedonensis]